MTMETTQYIVELIPNTAVEKVYTKHRAEIDAGASVWDFTQPEYLTQSLTASTEKEAWDCAKRHIEVDEFGEVHVLKQDRRKFRDDQESWADWITTARAVVYHDTTEFDWDMCDCGED